MREGQGAGEGEEIGIERGHVKEPQSQDGWPSVWRHPHVPFPLPIPQNVAPRNPTTRNPHTWLAIVNGTATLENWLFHAKINISLPYDQAIPFLDIYPK